MTRLKTGFWVDALRWRAESANAAIYVVRKGDADAGIVLVKVSILDGTARLYAPMTDFNGQQVWTQPLGDQPVEEAKADAYAQRRYDDDPDLWLVEIEDRHGRHFLTEPLEKC